MTLILVAVFVTLALHFTWEVLQAPAFVEFAESTWAGPVRCFVASLGDVLIAAGAYGITAFAFRSATWPLRAPSRGEANVCRIPPLDRGDVCRLRFLRAALEDGFSLADIRQLLALRQKPTRSSGRTAPFSMAAASRLRRDGEPSPLPAAHPTRRSSFDDDDLSGCGIRASR